jgi:cell division protein FtsB
MKFAANPSTRFKMPEKLLGPLALALGIFYIVFHVFSGEHGLYALLKEERTLELLQTQLSDVETERKDLEHRVHLMSDKSLDRDMLDEQARTVLNTANPNEIVIPLK